MAGRLDPLPERADPSPGAGRIAGGPVSLRWRGFFPAPWDSGIFLTERYCLYTIGRRGQIVRGEIHHPPWPLQAAEAEVTQNAMAEAAAVALPARKPLLYFAKRQDVVVWWPARLT